MDKVYDQVLIEGDQTDPVPGEAVPVTATQETGPQDSGQLYKEEVKVSYWEIGKLNF